MQFKFLISKMKSPSTVSVNQESSSDDLSVIKDDSVQLKRRFTSSQIQLLSLGACIGTSLLVNSGQALKWGAGSLLISYIILSFILWNMTTICMEMAIYLPLQGTSAFYFIDRYVDSSLAFASGILYLATYTLMVPSELVICGVLFQYWLPNVNVGVWITVVLITILALNLLPVNFYGTSEFWFNSIKVIAIVGMIILGIVLFFGGGPNHDRLGFRYWKEGAFVPYIVGGSAGRFLGFWSALIKSSYGFLVIPEIFIGAAGEVERPRANLIKASNRFIWRIIIFYIGLIFIIGVTVSHKDSRLLGASGSAASPIVISIKNASIPVLDHIINAVILTAAWSSGNSFIYISSRTLYSLGVNGYVPKFFAKCTKKGVPVNAVLSTAVISLLSYLNVSNASSTVFNWFTALVVISGFICWIICGITYLRFRKAIQYNDIKVPYKAKLQPYSTYFTMGFLLVVVLTNGYVVFFPQNWNLSDFFASYINIPLFILLYVGHLIYRKIKGNLSSYYLKVADIDVITGKSLADKIEDSYPEREPKNVYEKVWFWIV